ncbi:MAG: choice-of-anchor tandem repeat GloVer-containing protein [Bryobacteraceae bacterium]|jgi:uncharacterized repeat protein (TIGR03803 family)
MHSFSDQAGSPYAPAAGLIQATDGNLYGTTAGGGTNLCGGSGCGTVFKIGLGGKLAVLYNFAGPDGSGPEAGLIQATDGNFYGTTFVGGPYVCPGSSTGCGTVFKVTPRGELTTLHSFNGSDGSGPWAGLVQGTDGSLYGTTFNTVFKITLGGTLTTLHTFDGTDGDSVSAGLVQATDGNFYGTTGLGGASPY